MIYYQTEEVTLYHGDAIEIMKTLPDKSVNCIVTSPPYWQLRDYGVKGQYGNEPTLEEYLSNMVKVFKEAYRVLKNDGTMWLNFGDAYAGSGKGRNADGSSGVYQGKQLGHTGSIKAGVGKVKTKIKSKSLMMIPARVAIALIDSGWILRNDLIWEKTCPMPEGVTDRFTTSHEYVYFFVKNKKYYFNQLLEVRSGTDYTPPRGSKGVVGTVNRGRRDKGDRVTFRGGFYTNNNTFANFETIQAKDTGNAISKSLFKNARTVLRLPTSTGRPWWMKEGEEHYARFPNSLVEPFIAAGCLEGGVVLDMFSGTGTTGEEALKQNKKYIGIDISEISCRMATRRLQDPVEALLLASECE